MTSSLIIGLPILFFSIILHEYLHGAIAYYFGDDTAKMMGRLTFNPWPHVDPVGTLLLPAICLLNNAPLFGWAKPVPVAFYRLKKRPWSIVLVSASGPLANLFLACAASGTLHLAWYFIRGGNFGSFLVEVINFAILINLYLFIFNLLPVHPLDGSRVVSAVLPRNFARLYDGLAPYGFLIIMILIISGLFGRIVSPIVYWLYNLLVR